MSFPQSTRVWCLVDSLPLSYLDYTRWQVTRKADWPFLCGRANSFLLWILGIPSFCKPVVSCSCSPSFFPLFGFASRVIEQRKQKKVLNLQLVCPFPTVLGGGRASCWRGSLQPDGCSWCLCAQERAGQIDPHATDFGLSQGRLLACELFGGAVADMSKAEKREDKSSRQQQNQIKLHPPFAVKLCFVFLVLFSSHSHQSVVFFWFSRRFVPRSSLCSLVDHSRGQCVCRQYFSFSPRLLKRRFLGKMLPPRSVCGAHQRLVQLQCVVSREALCGRGIDPVGPQPGCVPSLQWNWVRGLQQNCLARCSLASCVPVQPVQLGWAYQEIRGQLCGLQWRQLIWDNEHVSASFSWEGRQLRSRVWCWMLYIVPQWERQLTGDLECEVGAEHPTNSSALLSERCFHGQCSWHGHVCVCI